MKKYMLVAAVAVFLGTAANAANTATKEGPMTKIGHGLMWGPKKIGEGAKSLGAKTKAMFHKK